MHWFIHHVQSHQITCQKISSEENQSVKPELNPRSFMDGKDLCKLNKQYLTALMFMFCTFFLDKIAKLWHNLAKLTATELPLLSALVKPSSSVLDLGVNIDGQLTMADHVAALRRSCLFQLRQLRMVRSSLTLEAAKTLVHAFVSSRLDYCNSLLYGIGDGLLTKLQTVQNAAARVVTGTRKFDHITPVLR